MSSRGPRRSRRVPAAGRARAGDRRCGRRADGSSGRGRMTGPSPTCASPSIQRRPAPLRRRRPRRSRRSLRCRLTAVTWYSSPQSDGRNRLWVRPLNAVARPRRCQALRMRHSPFWSPDSRSIGFFSQGKVKVRAPRGRRARGQGRRLARHPRRRVVRGRNHVDDPRPASGGLLRLTNGGSEPVFATPSAPSFMIDRFPWVLAGRPEVLCSATAIPDPNVRGLYLSNLGERTRTRLTDGEWSPLVVDDHLLFLRGRTLMAQPLDLRKPAPRRASRWCCSTALAARRPVTWAFRCRTRGPSPTRSRGRRTVDRVVVLARRAPDRSARSSRWPTTSTSRSRPTAPRWPSARSIRRLARRISGCSIWRGASTTRLTSDRMNDAGAIWTPDGDPAAVQIESIRL